MRNRPFVERVSRFSREIYRTIGPASAVLHDDKWVVLAEFAALS
jgi:hypothetical protein